MLGLDAVRGFYEVCMVPDDPQLPITPCKAVKLDMGVVMQYCALALRTEMAKVYPEKSSTKRQILMTRALERDMLHRLITATCAMLETQDTAQFLPFLYAFIQGNIMPALAQALDSKRKRRYNKKSAIMERKRRKK